MSRVVVIGAGLGGLASAARLAKLGHQVALVERSDRLGGALAPVSQDGFGWDGGPSATLLPAALRDLFRKSGRPLERELGAELEPLDVIREHRFADRTSVLVPGGSRAAQIAAFDAMDPGLGQAWVRHVDAYAGIWETLRRHYVEVPWERDQRSAVPRELVELFSSRETLHKRLRRDFRDERLAMVAGFAAVAEGHDLRNVPSWLGVAGYLEQCFGAWRPPGGMGRIVAALEGRMATRGVQVMTSTAALDLVLRGGRLAAVRTSDGEIDADAVVVAVDPRRLPALAPLVARTMPAVPPVMTHVGLGGTVPDLPHELVIHGDPTIVVRPGTAAPPGGTAWTLYGRGKLAEDLVTALSRHGIDVRDNVVTRVDLSPRHLVEQWGGSPHGVLWQGRGTVWRRLGPRTPIVGVLTAGAHAAPGAGVPFAVQSGALVAEVLGRA